MDTLNEDQLPGALTGISHDTSASLTNTDLKEKATEVESNVVDRANSENKELQDVEATLPDEIDTVASVPLADEVITPGIKDGKDIQLQVEGDKEQENEDGTTPELEDETEAPKLEGSKEGSTHELESAPELKDDDEAPQLEDESRASQLIGETEALQLDEESEPPNLELEGKAPEQQDQIGSPEPGSVLADDGECDQVMKQSEACDEKVTVDLDSNKPKKVILDKEENQDISVVSEKIDRESESVEKPVKDTELNKEHESHDEMNSMHASEEVARTEVQEHDVQLTNMDVEDTVRGDVDEDMDKQDVVMEADDKVPSMEDASMNPEEDVASMNVSEAGDESMDTLDFVHTKEGAESSSLELLRTKEDADSSSMPDVEMAPALEESMEVVSPNDEDPFGGTNSTTEKSADIEEAMDIEDSTQDGEKQTEAQEEQEILRSDEGNESEETPASDNVQEISDAPDEKLQEKEISENDEDVVGDKQTSNDEIENNEVNEDGVADTEDVKDDETRESEEVRNDGTRESKDVKDDEMGENEEVRNDETGESEEVKEDDQPSKVDTGTGDGLQDGVDQQNKKPEEEVGLEKNDDNILAEDNGEVGDGEKNKEVEPELQKEIADKGIRDSEVAKSGEGEAAADEMTGNKEPSENVSAYPDAAITAEGEDEEICIIPDDVDRVLPKVTPKAKAAAVTKSIPDVSKAKDSSVVAKPTEDISTPEKSQGSGDAQTPSTSQFKSTRPQRQAAKRAETQIKELAKEDSNSNEAFDKKIGEGIMQMCYQCCRVRTCKYQVYEAGIARHICQEQCFNIYRKDHGVKSYAAKSGIIINDKNKPASADSGSTLIRKCAQCSTIVNPDGKNLFWETMDFCNEECLGKYQTALGSHCANCKGSVQPLSLGKYCVRFGYDIKQFCCSTCLEEFKKGLKVCSYCQKDISSGAEGFLAPVGDKGQFKDFCTQSCMEKYDMMSNNQPLPPVKHQCAVCNDEKLVKIEVIIDSKIHKLCSEPCFAAFKFVNTFSADKCDMCKKYFDKSKTENLSVFYEDAPHQFCCKTCMNVYILANRKIVPCNWCKVKKYNFDMIKRIANTGQVLMMCSLNCLTLYQVSVNAVSSKLIKCDFCKKVAQAQYHLTMSDATIRNFCTYQCVMQFQGQYPQSTHLTFAGSETPTPVPTGGPRCSQPRRSLPQNENDIVSNKTTSPGAMPIISGVKSLAPNGQQPGNQNNAGITTRSAALKVNNNVTNMQSVVYKQQVIVKPPEPKPMRNKGVLCRPYTHTKGVSCKPHMCTKETQTDDSMGRPVLIPVPVPIYIPCPMNMYSNPFPVPVPFPLPVPVPIFIPTTRNSSHGILKEIKRIQEKIPTDPFEAELLMMAEMVAGEKKPDNSDSDSDDVADTAADVSEVPGEGTDVAANSATDGGFSPEAVDTSNTFGDDMLQMALKMASELEEPAVDLEAALTPSTITAQSQASMEQNDATESEVDDPDPVQNIPERAARGRKRPVRSSRTSTGVPSKRGRRMSSSVDIPLLPPPEPAQAPRVEQEKPDANMCLKYTFGVNAWRQWVQTKNAELEKAATNNRKLKLFKPEILQLTADELNYSLCLFVKEVRKPNGSEYAPDTIYYLCLGIQQYLFENGRIDNIFTDSYYEKYTECLDEVAKKFAAIYNDSQYIVTRVEEEHLWESKQLGAHSPHVLLSTLMFFNTKHFNLTTVDEHMQLSFSHIMKHWKRNPNQPGVTKIPGSSRNVLLRFYPPQTALEGNSKKKKVYEQQENEDNPLRCPVKLYEFYLSKCPESVKTRNDVFYLLPERSCVPDSPVWYSTMALGKEPLVKMLHRVKMVKEINVALLSS